jgi:hypothetical protein
MKTLRILLGILALFPAVLLGEHIFIQPEDYYQEDSVKQLIFMVLGIPILILNLWAWIHPEVINMNVESEKSEERVIRGRLRRGGHYFSLFLALLASHFGGAEVSSHKAKSADMPAPSQVMSNSERIQAGIRKASSNIIDLWNEWMDLRRRIEDQDAAADAAALYKVDSQDAEISRVPKTDQDPERNSDKG